MHRIYFVAVRFRSQVENDENGPNLFEDSIRSIVAPDEEAAEQMATRCGIESEHAYENEDGNRVVWTFESVVDVQELCEPLETGVEVYSRMNWE